MNLYFFTSLALLLSLFAFISLVVIYRFLAVFLRGLRFTIMLCFILVRHVLVCCRACCCCSRFAFLLNIIVIICSSSYSSSSPSSSDSIAPVCFFIFLAAFLSSLSSSTSASQSSIDGRKYASTPKIGLNSLPSAFIFFA